MRPLGIILWIDAKETRPADAIGISPAVEELIKVELRRSNPELFRGTFRFISRRDLF
jgi:hypothetical protein